MDQALRNKLRNVVTKCRKLLEDAVAQVLQGQFGIYPSGKKDEVHVEDEARMGHLGDEDRACRQDLLDHFQHIIALGYKPKDALAQLVREVAFTHLNRLCAYKMMEAREVWVGGQRFREAVSRGLKSQGFLFYLAQHPEDEQRYNTGHQDVAYRHFLDWLGGTLSEEIGVLFSPTDPANRLYPPQRVLDDVLDLLNTGDIKAEEKELQEAWPQIWSQDETIGWVYQYFTPKELRDQARKESAAPRNSYELAFRNQFFTPRYVVQFLTDNTLGRIWYEMRQGQTKLIEKCQYLVRRPDEVFQSRMTLPGEKYPSEGCVEMANLLQRGDESTFDTFDACDDESIQRRIDLGHCVDRYARPPLDDIWRWMAQTQLVVQDATELADFSTQELLDLLFLTCRNDRATDARQCKEDWFARAANEVRHRALRSREPDLPQDELLKQPVFIPFRAKKDPRELCILDPACGSGHFLLYCFDLLLTIYEEAWSDPELPRPSGENRGEGLQALHDDYPTLDALRRAVPRLVLAHNLHGIDIDLRATQIAALALWLRCQRAYKDMGLTKDRPKITRSNIVCAEPMPGEKEMLQEFVAELQPRVLGHLVEVVFDKMTLAAEAGSLLKIEEELRSEIAAVRKQWVAEHERAVDRKGRTLLFSQADLDRAKTKTPQKQLFDFSQITDEQFWTEAEGRVLDALREYASQAANGGVLRRQLFAEDAGHGFAFVDVCQKRFDVVLMNPPFGEPSKPSKGYIEKTYSTAKTDSYAAFVERGVYLLLQSGLLGAITSRTGFFLSSFQTWRETTLLCEAPPTIFADLGHGVLDTAMVETAAYCLRKANTSAPTMFFRLLQAADKEGAILTSIGATNSATLAPLVFQVIPSSFAQIHGSPFAYWVSGTVRRLFTEGIPFNGEGRAIKVGLQTGDDFRFVRCWWEVTPQTMLNPIDSPDWESASVNFQKWCRSQTSDGKQWVPFAKGGEYSPFYSDIHLVVNWGNDGSEIKSFVKHGSAKIASRPQNAEFYFRHGLTWSDRTTRSFSARIWPAGGIFSVKGSAGFFCGREMLALGTMNTSLFNGFLSLLVGAADRAARSYQVGTIGAVPFPAVIDPSVEELAKRATDAKRSIHVNDETNKSFCVPLAVGRTHSLMDLAEHERVRLSQLQADVDKCMQVLDEAVVRTYRLGEQDSESLRANCVEQCVEDDEAPCDSDSGDAAQVGSESAYGLSVLVCAYAVGCIVGRWDIGFATEQRRVTALPDPFQPLPVCSPGMLQNADGLPAVESPQGYPLRIDWDGILTDDPEHTDDIVRRVRDVVELIWKDRAEAIEKETCEILGVRGLRDYFRKPSNGGFWADHISRYSKSRRKAPIYWLLQSSKKNYALWLYYHRLDKDILFKALVNYVEPKIRLEESRLASVRSQKGSGSGTKKIDKEIEKQEDFLSELRDFEDKLRRAANLHLDPDLNDGVVLNIAPLWELVPWKEAKAYWEELMEGKYEWSSIGKQLRQKGLVK